MARRMKRPLVTAGAGGAVTSCNPKRSAGCPVWGEGWMPLTRDASPDAQARKKIGPATQGQQAEEGGEEMNVFCSAPSTARDLSFGPFPQLHDQCERSVTIKRGRIVAT